MDTKGKTIMKGLGFCASGIGNLTCNVDVDEENDQILRIRPFHFDENGDIEHLRPWKIEARGQTYEPGTKTSMGAYSLVYKKRVYSKNRILYPMKRIDWDPNGERNPQNRGTSEYVRISWDEALDTIANELKRLIDTYGLTSVLVQGDGHGESKMVHAPHGAQTQLLSLIGDGRYTFQCRQPDSWEGWYWGAKHMWGMDPFGNSSLQTNLVKDVAQNSDAIFVWGGDPETTPIAMSQNVACRIEYFFSDCGVKQIHIAPDANYANVVHADKWIPVLPNTDAALQLAIAYVWLTEGTYDQEYLDTHAVGFENWAYYVLGGEDGIPKTPKWAEKKCGVPSHTIKALARYWANHTVTVAHCAGGSFIRSCFAHEPARLEVALLGMQGLGKPGANQLLFMSWCLFGTGSVSPLPVGEEIPIVASAYRGRKNISVVSQIPKTMIPQAIMNPPVSWYSHIACGLPREDQFTGPFTFPIEGGSRVHAIWSDAPCWSTCWNGGNEMQDALRHNSIEFVLMQHPWFENDVAFADIILPVNTKFEESDIAIDGETGAYSLIYKEDQAIQPLGESISDMEIVWKVAERLDKMGGFFEGIFDRYTEGKTVDDWCKLGFEDTGAAKVMTYEEFKENKYYAIPTLEGWEDQSAGLYGFYSNPEKYKLATPSGKLEYYSTALAQVFPDDTERGPMPKWVEESEEHQERVTSKRAQKLPFLLVSNHPHWRVHAQHDDITWFREIESCKIVGPDGYAYEPIWVNPADAGKLGLEHGDIVKMYNERGAVLGGVYVTERIMPGVISQDHGARIDSIIPGRGGLDRGGANNLIAPSAVTSKHSFGEVTSGFLVNIEKVDVLKLAEEYPVQFGRDYDSECGIVATARVAKGE